MSARRFYFGALGGLGVLVAIGVAGDYFATVTLRKQKTVLQTRLAFDEVTSNKIIQLAELEKTYKKLKPLVPQIQAALPKSKQQSEVALQLQKLAASAEMTIPSVSFTAPKDLPNATSQTIAENGVLALPVTFQMEGTYPKLQTFLRSVENLNRYTGVSSLSISRKDDKSDLLKFDITVKVYIKP